MTLSRPSSRLRLFDMNLFELADFVSGYILLPTGALLLSLYVVFVWKFDRFAAETNTGAGALSVTAAWKPLMVLMIPVAVAVVLLVGLGVI